MAFPIIKDGKILFKDGLPAFGDATCCDCGGSGLACFQSWTASWNCNAGTWSGPTAGAKTCLPDTTSTAWMKVSDDGEACTYRTYVAMGHVCTADADCTGFGNTSTPSLPANADDCDCIPACFQVWMADYDCDGTTWTLTPGAKLCLPASTSTAWTGSGCSWTSYVAIGADCAVDGDCAALDDTAAPDPPFGGEEPPSCCNCLADCGCYTVGATATVSFAGVQNGMACIECPHGTGTSTFWRAVSGTLGTYTLVGGFGCTFELIVASGVAIATAEGPTGGGCPPDGDFVVDDAGFDIVLSFEGGTTWRLTVRGPEFGAFFIADTDQGDCSGPLVFTNSIVAYDPCTAEDWNKNGTATVVFTPCVPV